MPQANTITSKLSSYSTIIGRLDCGHYGIYNVVKTKYASNGALCILLLNKEDYTDRIKLSINADSQVDLSPTEFVLKSYSENEAIAPYVIKSPLFEKTDKQCVTPFNTLDVYRLTRM